MEKLVQGLTTIALTLFLTVLALNLLWSMVVSLLVEIVQRAGWATGVAGNLFLTGFAVLVVIGAGARVVGWIGERWRRAVRSVDGGQRPLGHSSRRHADEVPVARSHRRRRDPHLRLTRRDR